jgi:hypothetical protein
MGYKSATMIFGHALNAMAEVRTMLKRLETARADHRRATPAKNVFEASLRSAAVI